MDVYVRLSLLCVLVGHIFSAFRVTTQASGLQALLCTYMTYHAAAKNVRAISPFYTEDLSKLCVRERARAVCSLGLTRRGRAATGAAENNMSDASRARCALSNKLPLRCLSFFFWVGCDDSRLFPKD